MGKIKFSLLGLTDNNEHTPVNRDGSEREAAGVHGEVDEEVDHFAHEGAKHPALQRVDGGLERYAEDDEEEVGHAQVEYEQIGCVISDLPAPQKHGEHQAVANGPQQEDEGEHHWHDHAGGVQLVTLRHIRRPSRLAEILKVRHFARLKQGEREDANVKQIISTILELLAGLPCLLGGNLKSHLLFGNYISRYSIIDRAHALVVSIDTMTKERRGFSDELVFATFEIILKKSWQACMHQKICLSS